MRLGMRFGLRGKCGFSFVIHNNLVIYMLTQSPNQASLRGRREGRFGSSLGEEAVIRPPAPVESESPSRRCCCEQILGDKAPHISGQEQHR